jgi:type II secretory pathway component PulK
MMVESVIAVFLLGAIAGGVAVYLHQQREVRRWQRATLEAKEQSLMRAKLLSAVLRLARDAGALDTVTGEDVPPPRLTVVDPGASPFGPGAKVEEIR